MTSESIQLSCGNVIIHRRGNPAAPPFLALHGWMDNAASFFPLAEHLQEMNLFIPDQIGHGASDHAPAESGFHFIDFVPMVMELTEALEWQTFGLIGHSMGAAISTLVAGTYPERISNLILIEGMGPLSSEADEAPSRLRKALEAEQRTRKRNRRHFPNIDAAIKARQHDSDLDWESAKLLVENALQKGANGYEFTHDPRLRNPSRIRLTEKQVQAFFRQINAPSLFVMADKGWPFPQEGLKRRMQAIKNLRSVSLEGGHHIHMSHPKDVAEEIHSFLANR